MRNHPESALHIPLVNDVLADPGVRLVARGLDKHWVYNGLISASLTGFSPQTGTIYYPRSSRLATWLKAPGNSVRDHNENDWLVNELLFMIHDYLHIWAYRVINDICPQLGFGVAPVTKKNFETFVFCHLLTEAVATVGLDYWYLACVDLSKVLNVGTKMRTLATPYHEDMRDEVRRFHPGFEAQSPEFFQTIVKLYCRDEMPGFDARDLRRSPRLSEWLTHELSYGRTQRLYTRQWLSQFLTTPAKVCDDRVVQCSGKLQRHLAEELGTRLWDYIKNGLNGPAGFVISPPSAWTHRQNVTKKQGPDFRFININCIEERDIWSINAVDLSADSWKYLRWQILERYDCNAMSTTRRQALLDCKTPDTFKELKSRVKGLKKIRVGANETREIFLPE